MPTLYHIVPTMFGYQVTNGKNVQKEYDNIEQAKYACGKMNMHVLADAVNDFLVRFGLSQYNTVFDKKQKPHAILAKQDLTEFCTSLNFTLKNLTANTLITWTNLHEFIMPQLDWLQSNSAYKDYGKHFTELDKLIKSFYTHYAPPIKPPAEPKPETDFFTHTVAYGDFLAR